MDAPRWRLGPAPSGPAIEKEEAKDSSTGCGDVDSRLLGRRVVGGRGREPMDGARPESIRERRCYRRHLKDHEGICGTEWAVQNPRFEPEVVPDSAVEVLQSR